MAIGLSFLLLLVVAVVLWRRARARGRRGELADARAVEPASVPRAQRDAGAPASRRGTNRGGDDGSALLTGVVIGSVLFGGDSHARPSSQDDSDGSHDAGEDSGSDSDVDSGGGDGGFETGGDF